MCFANATSTAQSLLFYSVMKSNTLTNKFALVAVAVCALMLGLGHNASATPHAMPPSISLAIGDGHELVFVNFAIPSVDPARLLYVHHYIGMAHTSEYHVFWRHVIL